MSIHDIKYTHKRVGCSNPSSDCEWG